MTTGTTTAAIESGQSAIVMVAARSGMIAAEAATMMTTGIEGAETTGTTGMTIGEAANLIKIKTKIVKRRVTIGVGAMMIATTGRKTSAEAATGNGVETKTIAVIATGVETILTPRTIAIAEEEGLAGPRRGKRKWSRRSRRRRWTSSASVAVAAQHQRQFLRQLELLADGVRSSRAALQVVSLAASGIL